MLRRWIELALVLLVVGGGMAWWGRAEAPTPTTPTPTTPQAATSRPVGSAFELPDLAGGTAVHREGEGPLLMILAATGCADCRQRAPRDKEAYGLAQKHGVPVWSVLVYGDEASARAFVAETTQLADKHLVDSDGSVAVTSYGGSDSSCWILLNRKGEVVYRGAADVSVLQGQLDGLAGAAEQGP